MSDLHDMLHLAFAQRALAAGLLLAVLASLVGFFVVLRRMAFVAVGVSHAALGGVAIGVLLGQSPVLWAILFSIVVALGMAALGKRGLSEDTAMGVFFPAAMAFGVIVISFSPTWQRDLLTYLFGNILAVQPADLWLLGGTTLVVALITTVFFKELLFVSFDEESAHAAGVPVEPLRALLLVLTAVTVVVSIKVVGTVLVSAMLVVPAAAATQVTRRWELMLLMAWAISAGSLVTGLGISFAAPGGLQVPVGPAAVLVATACFCAAALVGRLRARQRGTGVPPAAYEPAAASLTAQ